MIFGKDKGVMTNIAQSGIRSLPPLDRALTDHPYIIQLDGDGWYKDG